jgi:segregation and condensation protein B
MIAKEKQKAVVEALLFMSPQPVPLNKMVRKLRQIIRAERVGESLATQETSWDETVFQDENGADNDDTASDVLKQLLDKKSELEEDITREDVKTLLKEIQDSLVFEDRGLELVSVAKGYQLRTKYDISLCLKDEKIESPTRLSPSSLEALAIVAYQQPVTKQKIEDVRGVDTGGVLKTLLEKEFLCIVGRSDEPGKPLVYGTSQKFLEVFGLNTLKDLPSLQEYSAMRLSERGDGNQDGEADPGDNGYFPDEPQTVMSLDSEMSDISEAERAILDDLDASLNKLKVVESDILAQNDFLKPEPKDPTSTP